VKETVVTGRGVVTPIGVGADAFLDALSERRSGIADNQAECTDFDAGEWLDRRALRRSDRFTHLAVAAAVQAIDEAGLADEIGNGLEPDRVAILIGTGIGGLTTLEREMRAVIEGGERAVSPHMVPMMMPNAATAAVAMRFGLHGPGWALASACATGAHAIGEGKRMLERGDADVVIAGGTEAPLTPLAIAAFRQMGALSKAGRSCPFDARRDGFVIGEGAGVLVLETDEHARGRGAKVRGRVAGYGASNDAFHMTQPDRDGRGAKESMRAALADADAGPGDVGYVNAHGTSTPFNDRIEAGAVREVWDGDPPPISSTKSAIGHLLGAAGAVEAVASMGALERHLLPPTLNYSEPDPDCEVDPIADGPRDANGLVATLSNSFGFGGQNASLVFTAA
jgi:3-oxoacyl-[acyl-carrier-protein] synthase II